MHIAAAEPRFLRREDVTEKDLETEREIARDAAAKSGKPENIVEKMVTGKMEKFYGEFCLLEQPYIKDDKATVTQYLKNRGKESGCEYTLIEGGSLLAGLALAALSLGVLMISALVERSLYFAAVSAPRMPGTVSR